MKFAPSASCAIPRGHAREPLRPVLRYTAPFMSYAFHPFSNARATVVQGMGMMMRALFTRAMGARMITTITTAAT